MFGPLKIGNFVGLTSVGRKIHKKKWNFEKSGKPGKSSQAVRTISAKKYSDNSICTDNHVWLNICNYIYNHNLDFLWIFEEYDLYRIFEKSTHDLLAVTYHCPNNKIYFYLFEYIFFRCNLIYLNVLIHIFYNFS